MWKRDEETPEEQEKQTPEQERGADTDPDGKGKAEPATIGPSITINGDVTGDEDLFIHGRVEGSVALGQQAVTVGREGRVNANITGRIVVVEGEVNGDLEAEEQIILRSAARVEGDLTSPRVVLEDGANFKGLVDMSNPSSSAGSSGRRSSPRSRRSSAASPGAGEDASGSASEDGDSDGADASAEADSTDTAEKATG